MNIQKNNHISALLVVYNEEAVIERCLNSISKVVREIIVIHDGPCKDNTLSIARKYTSHIYEQKEHKGIGEGWYLKGFSLCSNEWILKIDADEYLSPELKDSIGDLTSNTRADGYSFYWPMWDGSNYISKKALRKIFLFRKSRVGFLDKFHYPIKILGNLVESDLIVEHKPNYNNFSYSTFNKKQKRWAQLQAKDHLVPIGTKKYINLNYRELMREQKIKTILYNFPVLTFIVSLVLILQRLFKKPLLFFDKGFWIATYFVSLYSYEVAKEVRKLLKSRI